MERKSGFLTFVAALIPGVGYMYYGLVKKGVEAFILFALIPHIFDLIDMGWLGTLINVPFWFYLFFDTFNIAFKYRNGEKLKDSGFIIKDDTPLSPEMLSSINSKIPRQRWNIIAVFFIVVGIIAILNQVLDKNIYFVIKATIRNFLIPVILVVAGVYMLFKGKGSSEK